MRLQLPQKDPEIKGSPFGKLPLDYTQSFTRRKIRPSKERISKGSPKTVRNISAKGVWYAGLWAVQQVKIHRPKWLGNHDVGCVNLVLLARYRSVHSGQMFTLQGHLNRVRCAPMQLFGVALYTSARSSFNPPCRITVHKSMQCMYKLAMHACAHVSLCVCMCSCAYRRIFVSSS